ncbi:MAG: acyl-CoA dehydrogenase [Cryobacterium sp.]|nr:acyl-CoA dehydrogenase [Cryobacterium sp.]
MSDYRAPVSEITFALEHLAGYPEVSGFAPYGHADIETVSGILAEAGEFMANVVAPTNRRGDIEGSVRLEDGTVKTPEVFKETYRKYLDAGWGSVPFPDEFGGGNFPWSIGLAIQEMFLASNMAFALCPLLTQGAIDALLAYGSDEQKQTYLPNMIAGKWTGTMNLTEPQAGTDVGALKTQAVKQDDGTYAITGQKIFITYGEHDLAEQIVHLVLARTPGAPEGTKGISCFIVPKFHVNDDGSLGERNKVSCLSIEHKMGIHASPTCVMEYDGATGYLIGEENKGMRIMFVMMNSARLSVGTQGLALAERAFQKSLSYAQERIQGRAIGATKDSPIIDFPDVRRMLMTQRAYLAALRGMMYLNACQMDVAKFHTDEKTRKRAEEVVGLLTPICKSFGTDLVNELTSIALQIHGGMGFIEETGAAQHYRDARITAIYEGTNGVQAADLVGRKMPVRNGASFMDFISHMKKLLPELKSAGGDFKSIGESLSTQLDGLEKTTGWMLRTGLRDPNSVLAGSSPYLRIWGIVIGGWLVAKAALVDKKDETRLGVAKFYSSQILPQAGGLIPAATAGADQLFALSPEQLAAD